MRRHIEEFLAVAKCGSFTLAARSLDASVAHVSRSVKSLEQDLGVKLFLRTTRAVSLTPAGERLQVEFEQALNGIEEALEKVRSHTQSLAGRIRIACLTGSFADQVISPALADFATKHPQIELDVDFSPQQVDLVRQGYNMAIRGGHVEERGLNIIPLAVRQRCAAISPAYLEQYGAPQVPADLVNHACIRTFTNQWSFRVNGRTRDIEVGGRLRMNSGFCIRAACERGLGVAYMAEHAFGDAFETGKLIPVLEDYWLAHAPISMVFPRKDFVPNRITALADHLKTACTEFVSGLIGGVSLMRTRLQQRKG